ncbi:unnamed protein product [Blepharisma stoltei]|uniref:DUSP domain-containing protein n=1 Tax=Blepharisma stoltei TaxID=1481888 RepID=A0AAU9IG96_9CILI|nr:unnamed protein product [Blepharisma stoltei]
MDPNSQKQVISSIQPISTADLFQREKTVFLAPKQWWVSWCNYVGFFQDPKGLDPGPINNEILLENSDLKSDLNSSAVIFLKKEAWTSLYSWYLGGPEIEIFIIEGRPDLHPIKIYICPLYDYISVESALFSPFYLSLSLTIQDLKSHLQKKHSITGKFHLKVYESNGSIRSLEGYEDFSIREVNIKKGTKICIEKNDEVCLMEAEDEELKKVMEISMQDFHHSSEKDHTNSTGKKGVSAHWVEGNVNEFEMDFIDVARDSPSGPEIELIRERIREALQGKKVKLEIHSIAKIKKQLNRILEEYQSFIKSC